MYHAFGTPNFLIYAFTTPLQPYWRSVTFAKQVCVFFVRARRHRCAFLPRKAISFLFLHLFECITFSSYFVFVTIFQNWRLHKRDHGQKTWRNVWYIVHFWRIVGFCLIAVTSMGVPLKQHLYFFDFLECFSTSNFGYVIMGGLAPPQIGMLS